MGSPMRIAALLLVSATGLALAGPARGQTLLRQTGPAPYATLAGGRPLNFLATNDAQDTIALGFDFPFQGQRHGHVSVSTNGGVILSSTCTGANDCPLSGTARCQSNVCVYGLPPGNPATAGRAGFPDATLPQAVIAPLWDDLEISTGTVTYVRRGTAPTRELVVEWREVRHTGGPTGRASVQLTLVEDGTIRMHYGPMIIPSSESAAWSATAGFEDHAGANGDTAVPCAAVGPCAGSELALLSNTLVTWATPTEPELVVRPWSTPTGGGPGAPISVDVALENLGTSTTATVVQVDLRLSTDTTVDATDPLVVRRTVSALAPGDRTLVSLAATLPTLPTGIYTLGAIVDPQDLISEADETNNTLVLERNFLLGTDLSVQVDTPAPSGPGVPVDITVRLVNLGAATSSVGFELLYSSNAARDAGDVVVHRGTVGLAAGRVQTRTIPVVLPALAGAQYFVLAEIDPGQRIAEDDETNNLAVSPKRTTVFGPDLVAVSVSTPDPIAIAGAPLRFDAEIENRGDGAALDFAYSLRLSPDPNCTVTDTELLRVDGNDLAVGERLPIVASPVVPTTIAPGPGYSLCLLVNTAVRPPEDNLANNRARSQTPIDVTAPRPDFTFFGVRTPGTIASGELVSVERVALNQGLVAETLTYQVWLSEDDAFDPAQDDLLLTQSVRLDPGRQDARLEQVALPGRRPPGAYRLLYVADPLDDVPELDETNNVTASEPFDLVAAGLRFVTRGLPTAARDAPFSATLVTLGGTGPVTFELFEGSLPAGVRLAPNGTLSGTPTEEGLFATVFRARSGGVVAQAALPLLVVGPTATLEIASRALPIGYAELAYDHTLVAVGGAPPFAWRIEQGVLPQGLALSAEGRLSGTPALAAAATLDVVVEDALGATALATFALNVRPAGQSLRWAAAPLPDGRVGEPYAATPARAPNSGGVAPFVVTLVDGALPPGLELVDGEVRGTPTERGAFAFDLRLTDAEGDADRLRFVVRIEAGAEVMFFGNALPDAVLDTPYTTQLRAAPVGEVTFALDGGALPPGLSLAADGTIAGTPTETGLFTVVVRAESGGAEAFAAYGLEVLEAADPGPVAPGDDEGCRGGAGGPSLMLLWLGLLGLARRRRAVASGLGAGLLLLPAAAAAQVDDGYGVEMVRTPYAPQSGTPLTFVDGANDGDVQVGLPFGFRYFDASYDRVQVGSNGLLVFGGERAIREIEAPLPSAGTPNGILAPWWDDLTTGRLEVAHLGPPGDRVTVIEYSQVELTGNPAAGTARFQVRLYEGRQGRFDVCYDRLTGSTNGAAYSASTGFEDETGARGRALLSCGASCEGADFTRVRDTCFVARRDLGRDVVAVGAVGPDRAVAGLEFAAEVRADSLSSTALGPFRYAVFVVGPSPSDTRREVFRSGPVTLAPFARDTLTVAGILPADLAPGLYRFGATLDVEDALVEPDETDNEVLALGQTQVLEPRADLEASSVTRDRDTAQPGDTLRVTGIVQNTGSRAAEAAWRIVVSANAVASPSDRTLASGRAPLAAGGNLALDEPVPLPADLPAGRYWIGVVADPANEIDELDELDNGAVSRPLDVRGGPVRVRTSTLPPARVDLPYRQVLAAAGGDGAYAWRLAAGSLPDGLTLEADGELRGTPRATAEATFTVEVASLGTTATADLVLRVDEAAGGLAVLTRNLVPGTLGRAYPPEGAPGIVAVGATGTVRFTLEGTPPPGLRLEPDGRVVGLPEAAGDYRLDVRAEDDAAEARSTVGLTIAPPGRLTLVADQLAPARLGVLYEQALRAVGPTGGATVAFAARGAPPPGLQVSQAGLLVGTPTEIGAFPFVVSVEAGAQADEALFTLVVTDDAEARLVDDPLPRARVDEAYRVELRTEGLGGGVSWSWQPTDLPDGIRGAPIEVDGQGVLVLEGTPSRAARFSFLVEAEDAARRRVRAGYTIVVDPAPTGPEPGDDDGGCRAGGAGRGALWVALAALFARRRRRVAHRR